MQNNDNKGKACSKNRRNSKQKGKFKSQSKHEFDRDGSKDTRYDTKRGLNDPSWYTRNPNLSAASAQIPYPYRPGMSINISETTATVDGDVVIPGVLSLHWIPSVGNSSSATDPASIAAKEIYSRVRAAFSGSLEADAPDFMMYIMALDSVFAYTAWLKRIYRTLNAYSPDNYQTPDALLVGMGVPESAISTLRNNKVLLWQAINTLVLSTRKFTCPALMDVMNRHYWMSDNVYTDAASPNAQFYLFTPEYLYQYAEVEIPGDPNSNKAAGLVYKQLYNQTAYAWTPDGLLKFGTDMIDALVAWDDAYTISGYLKRAYDQAPSFITEEIPYDTKLEPVYSEEVLAQIENSRPVMNGRDLNVSAVKVAQDPLTNAVKFNVMFEYNTWKPSTDSMSYKVENGNHILTMRSDSPTVVDNIEATRLHAINTIIEATGDSKALANIVAATEIPLYWNYVSYSQATSTWTNVIIDTPFLAATADGAAATNVVNFMCILSQFDWCPIMPVITIDAQSVGHVHLFGDTHNVTQVSKDVLANINRVCLFSEFNAFDF